MLVITMSGMLGFAITFRILFTSNSPFLLHCRVSRYHWNNWKSRAMASCKTYGQKPLVNDRGLSLGSMHGVIGLKFSSLINSDLTWKKAAKGNRTSSRRARNSVSRSWNSGEDLIKMDSNTVDMSFSESEKVIIHACFSIFCFIIW